MSKFDIQPYFECQNRIFNVKIRYSAPVRMSKWDFECQNMYSARFECQNRISNVKRDIQFQLECQNRILNVKIRFSARF